MNKSCILAVALCVAFVTGCAVHGIKRDSGNPIDEKRISQIIDGKTTGLEVIGLFGAPTNTSKLGDSEIYIYKHCRVSGTGVVVTGVGNTSTAERCNALTVVVDKQNAIVRSHNFQKFFDAD